MRETEGRAMETAFEIDTFGREALSDVVALSLRAWEPVFRSIEQAMDPEVFRHFYPDWRVEQARAVETTCTEEGARVWAASIGLTVVGFVAVKVHDDSGMGEVYMIATTAAALSDAEAWFCLLRPLDAVHSTGFSALCSTPRCAAIPAGLSGS